MNDNKKAYLASMDLKTLRQDRQTSIARTREKVREQNRIFTAIRQALTVGEKTVPSLADALGMDTDTILIYVSTLKKYGIVGEGRKQDGYFTYQLIE